MTANEVIVVVMATIIVLLPIVLKIISRKSKKLKFNCTSCCKECPFADKCNKKQ